jgi:hypothetical protein
MGSVMSFPLARIHATDYRRETGLWVDKEMKRSLQFSLKDELRLARLKNGARAAAWCAVIERDTADPNI